MKKQIITAGIIAAAATTTGLVGVGVANAETGDTSTNPMSSLVDAIAKKFNLNKDEVQTVFDEDRQARDAERETEVKTEVAKLVTDGKLTQAQADKINAKRTELNKQRESERESFQNLSDEERKAKMDEYRTALDTWMNENDIPDEYHYLLMGGPGGRGHGVPDGEGRGQKSEKGKESSSTSSNSNNN